MILAKVEGRNPAYSMKCRLGAALVWDAEKRGVLGPGREMVEPTSGNTGIALAFVAATRGYSVTLTMPETVSLEPRALMAAYGAKVLLTAAPLGMAGAIAKAEEIVASDPSRYVLLQQFKNPANPAIHEATTGPEIWDDTDGNVDVIVAGVGTGGTLTGVARYWKKRRGKAVTVVAVEPSSSPVIRQTLAREPTTPGRHAIQGLGAGFIPDTFDLSLVDAVEGVTNEEAFAYARRLTQHEGIISGISSGAATAARHAWPTRRKTRAKRSSSSCPIRANVISAQRSLTDTTTTWGYRRELRRYSPAVSAGANRRVLCASNAVLLRGGGRKLGRRALPSREALTAIVVQLRSALFPWHFGTADVSEEGLQYYVGRVLDSALAGLEEQVRVGFLFDCEHGCAGSCLACAKRATEVTHEFASRLPAVRALLETDAHAAFAGDLPPRARTRSSFPTPE